MTIASAALEALALAPGWRMAEAVSRGEVAARELAEIMIARVRAINPDVHAFTHLDFDYWRRQASSIDEGDRSGVLAGVPIGVKDIFNTEVYPTEMGSPLWAGHKAGNDARCVSYLRWQGGLIAGKTDTAEFAVHAPNQVRNPWNTGHVTGTSSGGSAVAVATGMVPMALGTQTAGSTIRPASWCGTYAMKPSFGLIPRTGVLKTTDTLDNIGFYGRDGRDLELLLDVLRVRGDNYPGREAKLAERGTTPGRPWRVGFVRGHFWDDAPAYVRQAMETLASQVAGSEGIELVEVTLPEAARHAHALHRRVYNPCLAYYFREEIERDPARISESFMSLVRDGQTIPPADYEAALADQEQLSHDLEAVFDGGVDVLITHSSVGSAPKGAEPEMHRDLNPLWTLAWLPVINVPAFRCPQGLPWGYQMVGRRYSDYRLFRLLERFVAAGLAPDVAALANPT